LGFSRLQTSAALIKYIRTVYKNAWWHQQVQCKL
jgi:hypothetical protein